MAEAPLPAYVFHGEDPYEGRRFVEGLRDRLAASGGEAVEVETFRLDERRWRDVIDAARNLPFFFSPWRVLVVEGKGAGQEDLTVSEAAAFAEYFAAPAARTTIVVLFEGKIHKTKPLGQALAALPKSVVQVKEIFPLKDDKLKPLVEERFERRGKTATRAAVARILEITESDFARIDSEVEKISTYVGPKKTVDAEDVEALGSSRSFDNWELNAALEAGDAEKALVILDSMFERGDRPELILAVLSGFFRTALLAKAGLREGRDPRDVFREAKPGVSEKFGGFYQRLFGEYLAGLERIRDADLRRWLTELEAMDRKLKSTGISPREMIQAFVAGFGRKVSGSRVTSPGRR